MAFNPFKNDLNKKFDPEKYLKQKKAENSTPWTKFKKDILENEQITTKYSNQKRQIDEQHSQNYKKFLIETKKTESTTWEDFSSDPDPETKKIQKEKKKEVRRTREKFKQKTYDPNNLTTEDRNKIRKCITATTMKHKSFGRLQVIVGAMKRNGVKRNPFK